MFHGPHQSEHITPYEAMVRHAATILSNGARHYDGPPIGETVHRDHYFATMPLHLQIRRRKLAELPMHQRIELVDAEHDPEIPLRWNPSTMEWEHHAI